MKATLICAAAVLLAAPLAAQAPAPTGDQHRTATFAGVAEPAHYRLFVPSSYTPTKAWPMVVVLHGSGGDENGPFDRSDLMKIAEARGVILVAPFGNQRGGYGNIYPVVVTRETAANLPTPGKPMARPAGPPPRPTAAVDPTDFVDQSASELQPDFRAGAASEKETMNVVAQVRKDYRIDPARIYLMGNSMGGLGTAYLAVRYPELWAAIAPSGGPVAAWSYPFARLRQHHIAALFIHGEYDEHASAHWSQVLADQAKAEGVDATYLEVPQGGHGDAWTKVLPQTFDFFAKHPNSKH